MSKLSKRILFLSPKGSCAHYSLSIVDILNDKGYEVDFYDERPSQLSFIKVLIKTVKKKITSIYSLYIRYLILKNRKKDYDYVWIVRGEGLMPESFSLLKKKYPKAKFILYMWDVLNAVDVSEVIPLFDKVYSFCPKDSQQFDNIEFKPTFYLDKFKDIPQEEFKYDVFFAGSIYANRYKILNELKNILLKQNFKPFFYYYLPSRVILIKNALFTKERVRAKYSDFEYTPLSLSQSLDVLQYCKAVLDIRYGEQVSLSMRAFESLASKKKYITNNPEVMKYDFYNTDNVFVFNDFNDLDSESFRTFLNSSFVMPEMHIYEKYSLTNWVNSIIK